MGVILEDLVQELEAPISPAEVPDILARIQSDILLRSALVSGADEVVGGLEAGTVATLLGGLIEVLPIVLLVGAFIFLLQFLHRVLRDMARNVPIVHPYLVKLIDAWFPGTNPLSDWMARKYESLVHVLWMDITNVVGYFATRYVMIHHTATTIVSGAPLVGAAQEIAHIESQITALTSQVGQVWQYVHNHAPGPLPQGLVTLPEQIYKLQQDVQVLFHNEQSLLNDVQHAFATINAVETVVQNLAHELGAVHSVEVQVQDFVNTAEQAIQQLRTAESGLSERISTNTRSIGELAPLLLLLEPGIRGLRNLRKLEDKPCQCPQPRFMLPKDVEALAVIEFIENG